LNGFISGIVYQIAVKISYVLKIDDAMHICQTHGATSFYSLFSICLFHKTEGFFFNDVFLRSKKLEGLTSDEITDERSKIIVILGSNSLGALTVLLAISFLSFLIFKFLMNLCLTMRINKDEEICGLDTMICVQNIRNLRVKNHVADLINEFYPDNI
jgi:ammonia channel protein AmtB